MSAALFSRWQWRWTDLCGPEGLKLWSPTQHDLGLCFQQFFLQIPTLALLAVLSAYYFGQPSTYVMRGILQTRAIKIRLIISLVLALLPLAHVYVYLTRDDVKFQPVNVLLYAVQTVTWLVHVSFLSALKTKLTRSSRGPILICVIWSLLFVLSIISLRSLIIIYKHSLEPSFSDVFSFSCVIVNVVLQVFYAITLFPSEESANSPYTTYYGRRIGQFREQSPLLGSMHDEMMNSEHVYTRFLQPEYHDPTHLGVAMENTTWLSRLFFYWVNPLMQKGVDGRLIHPDDLFDLPMEVNSIVVSLKLDKALIGDVDKIQKRNRDYGSISSTASTSTQIATSVTPNIHKHNVSLIRALHSCFGFEFYGIGILKFASDCSGFAGPLLLNRLVSFIENKNERIEMGYLYSFGLFATALIGAFCNSHFNFQMAVVGLKIRASIVTMIYRKTLTAGNIALNSVFSVGEIVNFMSIDTDRIVNSCSSFHALWSIPFQLGVTLFLLYNQVGLAFIAGVGFSIILIPINKFIANKIGQLSTKMMQQKDGRIKLMAEVLRGIRTIKFHVWEDHFIRLISKFREKELKYLKGRKYLDALCVYFWATTPILISVLTFTTYVLMGNQLTAATVFTSIALLNMLISPLNAFPWVLNGVTEAWVSIKRIQKLIDLPDLNNDLYYKEVENDSDTYIFIENANFSWNNQENVSNIEISEAQQVEEDLNQPNSSTGLINTNELVHIPTSAKDCGNFVLDTINLAVKKGNLVGIMGPVGCGKSTLLSAIVAEVEKQNGAIVVSNLEDGFGLVAQQPWLQRGTIRDNILFGRAYDEAKYRNVIYACCLEDDLVLLPSGDMTGVGDSGATLSGGQRARIALARAVYQNKPVYLLDDVLASVDANVAAHIFQHCIMGILKNKTIILCSHHKQFIMQADWVVMMQEGKIEKQGKPCNVFSDADFYHLEQSGSEFSYSEPKKRINSNEISREINLNDGDSDSLLQEESRETGTIETDVYITYWKAIGHLLAIAILLSMILMQSSRNMTDLWLSFWVTDIEKHSNTTNTTTTTTGYMHSAEDFVLTLINNNSSVQYYLTIYGIFGGMNSVFTLFRAFLFAYGGIYAATKLHKILLRTIVKAKITFFDVSPVGRILNRFSSDTYTVDDSLPFIMNILLAQFFGVIGSVVVTVYGLPWLCLILVPLIPIYHWLQHHYRLTSRELKRLSSVTLSPVYNHFNETLQGMTTIRALRSVQRFMRDNEDNVETNQKAQFASQAAGRWLGLRLQFIGVAMVTGVGIIAVVQHQFDVADPGLIGLAISYALSVTGLLSGVVNAFTETEREMIAVERVKQYIEQVETEETTPVFHEGTIVNPPYAWPAQGVIVFHDVVLKYRDHLIPSLKGISFETRPAEKIGIVGRTGAGKSSLLNALFRMVELSSGAIFIDTVNTSSLPLAALRSRLSIIPQEPFLFSGTIRDNLDPLREFRSAELWSALQKCGLSALVKRLGGLETNLGASGQNLSVGQRQLMCLARAVLHKAKILCIDEATANVDQETDRQLQQTLRAVFRHSTVLTIAHRVDTVMDCDRVLVIADGQVAEFASPNDLMSNTNSLFYKLVEQQE